MRPWQVIERLASDNSRLFKEQVLSEHLSCGELQAGLVWALDPLVTFGVKKVPEHTGSGTGDLSFDKFQRLLEGLSNRTLTGNQARDTVQEHMAQSGADQWNLWYRRILLKDIKCGVSETTINKVSRSLGLKYEIPVFECMLAHDGAKHPNKIRGECLIEPKFDGVRVIVVIKNGHASLYSRNGTQLVNFPHIEQAFTSLKFKEDLVFDGEVMSENFQALMSQIYRKSNVQTKDAFLALFDVITLNEFLQGQSKKTVLDRKADLARYEYPDCVQPVDYEILDLDSPEGERRFSQINRDALAAGYEGLMIKPVRGMYECKRSTNWLKVKPYIEVTLEVVGFEPGTGKNLGRLGALIVEGQDDGKFYSVNVGSGFSDAQRDDFWQHRDKLLGELVEVRADAATQAQNSDSWSLRFPRFKTFRGFSPGEKI